MAESTLYFTCHGSDITLKGGYIMKSSFEEAKEHCLWEKSTAGFKNADCQQKVVNIKKSFFFKVETICRSKHGIQQKKLFSCRIGYWRKESIHTILSDKGIQNFPWSFVTLFKIAYDLVFLPSRTFVYTDAKRYNRTHFQYTFGDKARFQHQFKSSIMAYCKLNGWLLLRILKKVRNNFWWVWICRLKIMAWRGLRSTRISR